MPFSRLFISLSLCLALTLLNPGLHNTGHAAQPGNAPVQQNGQATITGKVTDTITASGVTYVEVDAGGNKVWAAAVGIMQVKKGDMVSFSTAMPMRNYHSKNLARDFSLIYFVKQLNMDGDGSANSLLPDHIISKQSRRPEVARFLADTQEVRVGGYLREATLDGLQGDNRKFSDYRGKPLIINVWASWCSPCRAEMGSLERLASRYNGKEFNIIGVSTDDYRDRAMALIRQTGITFENFIDHKLMLEKMLGANTIPLTILVDGQGRVLQKIRGAREWDSPAMIDAIAQAFQVTLRQ